MIGSCRVEDEALGPGFPWPPSKSGMSTIKAIELLASGLIVVAGIGCASAGPSAARSGALPEEEMRVIQVDNDRSGSADIYVIHGGARLRLGTVRPLNSEVFQIPGALAGITRFRLSASVGLHRTFSTEPILLSRGQRITWRLNERIESSTIMLSTPSRRR